MPLPKITQYYATLCEREATTNDASAPGFHSVTKFRRLAFMPGRLRSVALGVAMVAAAWGSAVRAATISVNPSLDNSIYAESDNSNGAGPLYVGVTSGGQGTTIRRGLVRFDIAGSIPAGSIINSVLFTLQTVVVGPAASTDVLELRPVLAAWGEGTSSGTGRGAAPTVGDATWNYRLYNADPWTNPGGDFGVINGTAILGFATEVTISSQPGMVADVQNWLNSPVSNNGWILKYADEVTTGTARAFGSHESPLAQRPTLLIDYTPAPEPGSLLLLGAGSILLSSRRYARHRTVDSERFPDAKPNHPNP